MTAPTTVYSIRVSTGQEVSLDEGYTLYLVSVDYSADGAVDYIDGSAAVGSQTVGDPDNLDLDAAIEEFRHVTGEVEWERAETYGPWSISRCGVDEGDDPYGGWTVATAVTTVTS